MSSNKKWPRNDAPRINCYHDSIQFQQIDIDHYMAKHREGMAGKENTLAPIMRMYGITERGNSVVAHVHGFYPYFYIEMPRDFRREHLSNFQKNLNKKVLADHSNRNSNNEITVAVLSIEIVKKQNVYGYAGKEFGQFLKITVSVPQLVTPTARIFEKGEVNQWGFRSNELVRVFESNIDFDVRFMVDTKVVGCNWIELPAGKYTVRTLAKDQQSRCQYEVDINWKEFVSFAPEDEWSKVAPFRVLSFDIECAGRKGIFPEPEVDPVIQIANCCIRQGEKEPFLRVIFCLKHVSPIAGQTVLCFERETELLSAWAKFIREVDPDILTGYNIQNFDLGYLIKRAATLNVRDFPYLGRIRNTKTNVRKKILQSKQMGKRENKEINIEGRCQFDLLLVLLRDYKLRSYTLNAVSFHFLGEQKEDVHHSIITDLQNGDENTRRRLAVYCCKDAILPLRLIEKLMCIINYMEMARVTGVPISYLLTRGQQVKVVSQILRKAATQNLIMPTMKPQQGDDFSGALVIEPKRGYYDVPIATLDFSSLYPSIMMAHNLCYTTLLNPAKRSEMDANDYIKTPAGCYFVKSSVRKGILPEILEALLGARKKAKDDLKKEKDPFKKKVLDGRQLALKISANSVYGFTVRDFRFNSFFVCFPFQLN